MLPQYAITLTEPSWDAALRIEQRLNRRHFLWSAKLNVHDSRCVTSYKKQNFVSFANISERIENVENVDLALIVSMGSPLTHTPTTHPLSLCDFSQLLFLAYIRPEACK